MKALLSTAAESMQGSLCGDDAMFDGVSTDTRTLGSGELYFALSGPNFDGADFVAEAAGKRAAGAVVARQTADALAQISVDDTRLALGRLAAAWRRQQAATVVGITGSNGKTTLKELTAACLARSAATLATAGNLNNDIGMPLMLLRLNAGHRFAVLEMGANHAGEIAYLAGLAQPDVVVITNAGAAHLEGFGSIEGVAHAKGEILQCDKRPDVAVLNADDAYFGYWRKLVEDVEMLSFGFSRAADVHADDIDTRADGSAFRLTICGRGVDVDLPIAGIHNVRNACAAAAVATALDVAVVDIVAGLESALPIAGRLQPLAARAGATLFDDSYNANPLSVVAAGEFIASLAGQSVMVLGDMKELGAEAEALHRDVGERLAAAGVERLLAFGELSQHTADAFGDGASWFASIDALIEVALEELGEDSRVLVKGSRSMRMERVVDALRAPDAIARKA